MYKIFCFDIEKLQILNIILQNLMYHLWKECRIQLHSFLLESILLSNLLTFFVWLSFLTVSWILLFCFNHRLKLFSLYETPTWSDGWDQVCCEKLNVCMFGRRSSKLTKLWLRHATDLRHTLVLHRFSFVRQNVFDFRLSFNFQKF